MNALDASDATSASLKLSESRDDYEQCIQSDISMAYQQSINQLESYSMLSVSKSQPIRAEMYQLTFDVSHPDDDDVATLPPDDEHFEKSYADRDLSTFTNQSHVMGKPSKTPTMICHDAKTGRNKVSGVWMAGSMSPGLAIRQLTSPETCCCCVM